MGWIIQSCSAAASDDLHTTTTTTTSTKNTADKDQLEELKSNCPLKLTGYIRR